MPRRPRRRVLREPEVVDGPRLVVDGGVQIGAELDQDGVARGRHAERVPHDLVRPPAVAQVLATARPGDGDAARGKVQSILLVAVGDDLGAVDPDLELLVVPRVDLGEVEADEHAVLVAGEGEPLADHDAAARVAGEGPEHGGEVEVLPIGRAPPEPVRYGTQSLAGDSKSWSATTGLIGGNSVVVVVVTPGAVGGVVHPAAATIPSAATQMATLVRTDVIDPPIRI